jgi:phage-related tail fiber protein
LKTTKGEVRKISETYFTLVTDIGTRKMLHAVHEGKRVNIVEFAVGDGNGECRIPTAGAAALRNEVWRGKVNDCKISEESENILIVESIISAEIGGFTIREMGVFDDEGDLIAICNTPDTAKVCIVDGVVSELKLQMEIILTNTESVNLTIDPSILTATKDDLEIVKKELEDKMQNMSTAVAFNTDIIVEAFNAVYGTDYHIGDDTPETDTIPEQQVTGD